MIGPLSARIKRMILFSASSLALLAASNAPALAQNDNTSHAPPAAALPQPPAATPPPSSPTTTQAPQQESATPAPQQSASASDAKAGYRRQCLARDPRGCAGRTATAPHAAASGRGQSSACANAGAGGSEAEPGLRYGSAEHSGSPWGRNLPVEPAGDRGAPAGREHQSRQGAIAGSGRNARLRRKRRSACAQRARQYSISHQRHSASRRRRGLRPDSRYRDRRQPCPDHRRVAGPVRLAHVRCRRHPDQNGCIQQQRQRQPLWRQSSNHHALFRIRRHGRTDPVFRDRAVPAEQSGIGESDARE